MKVLNCKIEYDFDKNIKFKGGFSIWELLKNNIILANIENTKAPSNKPELDFETQYFESQFKKLKQTNLNFMHEIHK